VAGALRSAKGIVKPLKPFVPKRAAAGPWITWRGRNRRQASAGRLQKTMDALPTTLKASDQLIRHVDARVTPMADNLMETSTRLRATIARVQQVVDGDVVRVLQDANRTLQEFSGAARSARLLTDYLERNPDALVYGKGQRRT
jgi:paraquat-inducible protein B